MSKETETCWLCLSTHPTGEGITHYTRKFECSHCGTEWIDAWCSDCEDECRNCGTYMTRLEILKEEIIEWPEVSDRKAS